MTAEIENTEKYLKCLEDIGKLLYKTSVIFQGIEKDFVKKQNISTSQATLLIMLLNRFTDDMNMTEVISEMNLEKSTVTRLIDSLVEKNYICKRKNSEDKREINVQLTYAGKHYAQILKGSRMDYYRNILKRLPKGKVREVMNSFELLVDVFKEENI
ncbi:MAG: MarR family transcriptional regulator [Spirochaetes bacterium]|nr:MarR family transcriptional regulator [Spirochaetota bacterium]